MNSTQSSNNTKEQNISEIFKECGFRNSAKISDSLQGSVWSSERINSNSESESIDKYVIKVTSKQLHKRSSIKLKGVEYFVQENIKKEAKILKYLSSSPEAPDSIIKYVDFFQSNLNYYLILENGGHSLFDFVSKAHNLILINKLDIDEWHRCCNVIFKQLINTINYIHSMNVCHFDISLENILINDVEIITDRENKGKIRFCTETIKIKLIDFGLAEYFDENTSNFTSSKYVGKESYKSPEVISNAKTFDAQCNDIWCCGVVLFMMIIGSAPWRQASINDKTFVQIMDDNIMDVIDHWGRIHYISSNIIDLISKIFQYEMKRITIKQIKDHPWIRSMDQK